MSCWRCRRGVFPVTTLVVGWPAEDPPLRDRLPLDVIVHQEQYERLSDDEIRAAHAEREQKAWARYNAYEALREALGRGGHHPRHRLLHLGVQILQRTAPRVSEMLIETLQEQGLWL